MLNIVFFCILIIFLGLIFSKIKISVEKIELNINNADFRIRIGFFLFGFLKIFGIKCDKNGIIFLGKFFSYKKIFNLDFKEIKKKNLKKKDIKIADELNIKIDFARFTLKIGAENIFITVFLVTLISSLIPEFLKKKVRKVNNKNINYKILPEFNKLEFYYEGKIIFSIKTINLKNVVFNTRNNKIKTSTL